MLQTESIAALMLTFPWGLTLGPSPPYVPFPTKIVMEVLPPMLFDGGEEGTQDEAYVQECDRRVRNERFKLSSASSPKNHEYL